LRAALSDRDVPSQRTASERIFTYGVQVAVRFTYIHGIRSLAIIGMILLAPVCPASFLYISGNLIFVNG